MNCLGRIIKSYGPKGLVINITRFLQMNMRSPIPVSSKLVSTENSWIWQQNDRIQSPILNQVNKIDLPNDVTWIPFPLIDPSNEKSIEAPSTPNSEMPKEAVSMLIIRRKKMKKHKLKKLRKRLRFYRAKLRQRREWKKEKVFQAELLQKCKEGESFSAEEYVNSRLAKLNELVTDKDTRRKKSPALFSIKSRY